MNIPLLIVAGLFFLVGFWGFLIPVIPDLPVIWLGVLIYALGTSFNEISVLTVLILAILSLSTFAVDYLATSYGAKRYGATKAGIAGALIGGVIGFFLAPPVGLIAGSVLGALAAELYFSRRPPSLAIKASKGVVIGLLFGLLAKVIIAGVIIGVFLASVL